MIKRLLHPNSTRIGFVLIITLATGCSNLVPKFDEVLPDRRTEYKKSKSLPDLEIPPDLTTDAIQDRMVIPTGDGESASYSTFQERTAERKRAEELERSESGAIKLLENEHILAVQGQPVQIWPQLRRFWQDLGYDLELDDEELGVVETVWNENQEELVRDKFKVFAEPGQEAGTTLLYISHRGEQLVSQGDGLVWQPRERDIQLERRVVERIEETLNGSSGSDGGYAEEAPSRSDDGYLAESDSYEDTASGDDSYDSERAGSQRAELISAGGGKVYLTVAEEFSAAWESTASALNRAGIEVEQEDRERGLYFIRMPDGENEQKKDGVWSKLKFWGGESNQFQLSLTGVGDKTEVVLLNREGKWETGDVAGRLLSRLNLELNGDT